MDKKRVLIVDDSAFMRKVISDIVNSDPGLVVADTAKNGQEAVQKVQLLKPDVMTLDVEMPVMDGLSALEVVMRESPLPVIMLSSVTKEGADATLRALELGALDFITKPSSIFQINTQDMQHELLNKLKMASRVSVRARSAPRRDRVPVQRPPVSGAERAVPPKEGRIKKIIAIGTSTGGPKALQDVIPQLPANLPASVVVVQHMPPASPAPWRSGWTASARCGSRKRNRTTFCCRAGSISHREIIICGSSGTATTIGSSWGRTPWSVGIALRWMR